MDDFPKRVDCAVCDGVGHVMASTSSSGSEALDMQKCGACRGLGKVFADRVQEPEAVKPSGFLRRLIVRFSGRAA